MSQSLSGRRGRTSKSCSLTDGRRIGYLRPWFRWCASVLAVGACLVVGLRVRSQVRESARGSVSATENFKRGAGRAAATLQSAVAVSPSVVERAVVTMDFARPASVAPRTVTAARVDGNRVHRPNNTAGPVTSDVTRVASPTSAKSTGAGRGTGPEDANVKGSPSDGLSIVDLLHHEALRTRN